MTQNMTQNMTPDAGGGTGEESVRSNETEVGGIVLLMTTPVSDPVSDPDAWNFLPSGEASWVFLILMNQMANRLSQAGGIETPNTEPGAGRMTAPLSFLRLLLPNWPVKPEKGSR